MNVRMAEENDLGRVNELNRDALAFYEAMGFTTYRRYMEMEVGD